MKPFLMKALLTSILLLSIIGIIGALDTESYQFINYLVNLNTAGEPEVFDDAVLFTAPSSFKKVGIAFAHEGFSKVYWFKKLMVPDDSPNVQVKTDNSVPAVKYKDAGILFYTYTVPMEIKDLEYRLVINGLWTADPVNPNKRIDGSGIARSVAPIPHAYKPLTPQDTPAGSLSFRYQGRPGETVYVAGTFNNWDPFMYELTEQTSGSYTLTLSLPRGVYQYTFFVRGERIVDPNNLTRVYREGMPVSQAEVK